MPKMLLATAFVLAAVAALPSTVSAQAKPAAKPAAAAPAAETDAGKAAAKQAAEEKQARDRDEAARKRAEIEDRCVIKAVMTDAEIDLCRKAGRR